LAAGTILACGCPVAASAQTAAVQAPADQVPAADQIPAAGQAPAEAQSTPTGAQSVQSAQGLGDIIVTARKRKERLQDLGSSATALSETQLEQRPDVDLSSFANSAPSVIITDMNEGPGAPASMTIRGIGTSDHERSIDPTIGVVVDGVFIGTVGGAMVKALDLESIQILRGPQGTLFGRNSIGGAILLDRIKPDFDDFAGKVRAGYGNYDDLLADGYVNIPIGDFAAVKVGGAFNRHDGYFWNETLDRRQGFARYKNFNAAIRVRPFDGLDIYYRFDKDWTDQDASVMQNVASPDQAWCFFYNQCAPDDHTPQGGSRYVSLQNSPGFDAWFNSDMHVLTAHWDIGKGYALDYLFGLFKTRENGHWDFDGTPLSLYDTTRPQQYHQRSHELRFSYNDSGPLTYTLGLYLYNSRYHIDNFSFIGFGDLLYGLPPGTVLDVPQTVAQKTRSYAAFFEGDLKLLEGLTLTAGGRYTHDKKRQMVADPLFPQLADYGGFDNPASKGWSEFTPKLGLRYRFNPNLMVYGLYSKGFRAGGFSGRPGTYEAAVIPYDPETVDNFELGFKSDWLDNRVRLNVAAYRMNYKNKQEELSVPVDVVGGTGQQTLFVNAATARLQGIEVELAARPIPRLTLNSALGYLDAKYTDFNDPLTGQSLTYLRLRRAPKYTFSFTPAYEFPVAGGNATLSGTYYFLSKYENTFWNTPGARNGASHVIDAQASWTLNQTTFTLYGRNLTKDDSYTIGLDVGRSATFPGLWTFVSTRAPRTYGFTITQKF
jgi:iron complex outermembrane receptor protein